MGTEEPANRILLDFQTSRSSGAFLCRYLDCPRAAQGFSSSEIRQSHEDSHRPRFQCTHAPCGFFGMTFKTRAAMKKHAAQYHDEEDTASVPNLLIRKPRGPYEDRSLFTVSQHKRRRGIQDFSTPEEVLIVNKVTSGNSQTSMASSASLHDASEGSGRERSKPPTTGSNRLSEILQVANTGHLTARSNSPAIDVYQQRSPFQETSGFAPRASPERQQNPGADGPTNFQHELSYDLDYSHVDWG